MLPISPCSVNSYIENLAYSLASPTVVLLVVPYQGFPRPAPISKYIEVLSTKSFHQKIQLSGLRVGSKNLYFSCTMEYYSALKKNEIMPFAATWMDLEIIILSKSDRERQMSFDITYIWNLKNDTNELIYKTEIDSQT